MAENTRACMVEELSGKSRISAFSTYMYCLTTENAYINTRVKNISFSSNVNENNHYLIY